MADHPKEGDKQEKDEPRLTIRSLILVGVGVLAIALYSFNVHPSWVVFASGLLFGTAALTVGGFLGFLFGVPRTLSSNGGGGQGSARGASRIAANTNLEQVSDWLTKLLLGATLVQLGKVPSAASRLFNAMASTLGGVSSSAPFAGGIVIYFATLGFLGGWLFTRLYLGRAMSHADEPATLIRVADKAKREGHKDAADALEQMALNELRKA